MVYTNFIFCDNLLAAEKTKHTISKVFFFLFFYQIQYTYQYDVFLYNKQFCTFLFSVPMGVLSLRETGGTSRILKPSYRCCIGGAVTWRSQRGTAAIKWSLLSVQWRCVEFKLRWTLLTLYMCFLRFQLLLIARLEVVLFVTVLHVWL